MQRQKHKRRFVSELVSISDEITLATSRGTKLDFGTQAKCHEVFDVHLSNGVANDILPRYVVIARFGESFGRELAVVSLEYAAFM